MSFSNPKVCIIGAGLGGLTAAIKLHTELGLKDFWIYDQNIDVGGTWLTNIYPGCGCDFPIHLYCWSFAKKPDWTATHVCQQEILEYVKDVVNSYDIRPHVKLQTRAVSATWDEGGKQWSVVTENLNTKVSTTDIFDYVIVATGYLHMPHYPIEYEKFLGQKCHTANWNPSITLSRKVVGIVGSGSSGVQLIPSIQPFVKELHSFQRNPCWVIPKHITKYPTLVKWIFRNVPLVLTIYRWYLFWKFEMIHPIFVKRKALGKSVTDHLISVAETETKGMNKTLVLPNYTLGCKNAAFSSTYYPSLTAPNVKVHTSPIVEVDSSGLTTQDGNRTKLDVLVLATGFEVQDFFAPLKIIGKDGKDVMTEWKNDRPKAYCGVCSSAAPNLFFIRGPYGILGHNSAIFLMECQANFIISMFKTMRSKRAASFQLTNYAEEVFLMEMDENHKGTVWGDPECSSFHKNNKGLVTTVFPGTAVDYWRSTRKVFKHMFHFN